MIKKYQKVVLTFLFLSTSFLFHGCGGGSVSVAEGGISGTGITMGRISNFGSIIVNGVRFDVDSASFIRDGEPAIGQEVYSVGEYVVIKGTIDSSGLTGVADEVTFTNQIEGAVTMASTDGLSIEVLGQKVVSDALTVFIGFNDISTLLTGNIIEVSGIKNANGDIQATSIKLKAKDFIPGSSENDLKGVVSALNTSTQTFTINGITIEYSQAVFEKFGSQLLKDGLLVDVESDSMIIGNVLKASKIELEDGAIKIDEGAEAKIEGRITRFDSATDFDVNGLKVTTNQNTEYSDGNSNDLVLGAEVELEGKTNSAGVIVAKSIGLQKAEAQLGEYEGFVDSIDLNANTVTLSSKTVILDSTTIMKDESDLNVSPLTLADLAVNDKVKVVGTVLANGEILASKFERKGTKAEEQNEAVNSEETSKEPNLAESNEEEGSEEGSEAADLEESNQETDSEET